MSGTKHLAFGWASFDSNGVLVRAFWTSSHSSQVSILTVPWSGGAFFMFRSIISWDLDSSSIIRSFAKRAVPATVRIIGIVAVSRNDLASGTSMKIWFFLGSFHFLFFSISATLFFKLSLGPTRNKVWSYNIEQTPLIFIYKLKLRRGRNKAWFRWCIFSCILDNLCTPWTASERVLNPDVSFVYW